MGRVARTGRAIVGRPAFRPTAPPRSSSRCASTTRRARAARTATSSRTAETRTTAPQDGTRDVSDELHGLRRILPRARRLRFHRVCDAGRPHRGPLRIRHRAGGDAGHVARPARARRLHADGACAQGRDRVRAAIREGPRGPQARGRPGDRRAAARVHRLLRHGQRHHPPGFPRPECNPSDIAGIAGVAAAGATPAAGTPAVPTFVIGVASNVELSSIGSKLDQIATGGGTAPAIHRHQPGREPAAADASSRRFGPRQSRASTSCRPRASTSRRSTSASHRARVPTPRSATRRSTAPTAPAATSAAAGTTTRIPPPARRPRSPPARPPARRSRRT